MAKVWMVKEGSDLAKDAPWRTMPLPQCQEKLSLSQANFKSDLTRIPTFGDTSNPLVALRDPIVVFVEIDCIEAEKHQWKPGFYMLDIEPKEANGRCAS
jgi:hypothetical protein